jgi:glutamine synthetase
VQGDADRHADPSLPRDIVSALHALERGPLLAGYFPKDFPRLFAELKRAEAESLFANVQPIEHDYYL